MQFSASVQRTQSVRCSFLMWRLSNCDADFFNLFLTEYCNLKDFAVGIHRCWKCRTCGQELKEDGKENNLFLYTAKDTLLTCLHSASEAPPKTCECGEKWMGMKQLVLRTAFGLGLLGETILKKLVCSPCLTIWLRFTVPSNCNFRCYLFLALVSLCSCFTKIAPFSSTW